MASSVAAAVLVAAGMRGGDVADSFVGVGVDAGDQDDVAEVGFADVAALGLIAPGQQRLGAHVVIDEGSAVAARAGILERSVQQVPVEDECGAGRDLDRDGVGFGIREAVGLFRAVVLGVVLIA